MIDRDAVIGFLDTHRVMFAAVAASVLVILLAVLALMLRAESRDKKAADARASARKEAAVEPGELWLPAEPLPVPGIQFFREARSRWSAEEVKEWYTVPDEAALEDLHSAGTRLVDELLESVP